MERRAVWTAKMPATAQGADGPRIVLDEVINPAYVGLLEDHSRWEVLMGGAGSGKSHFSAQKTLLRVIREPGHRIPVLRKVAKTNRVSTWPLFRHYISEWGLERYFEVNRSDMTITYRLNGGVLLFMGLDDSEKLKSITGVTSFWLEEATEMTEQDLNQVNLRLRGRMPHYKQILLSFNPVSAMHHLKRRFWDTVQPNARVVVTTYRDNPFLDDEYCAELERLREQDEQMWRIYACGEWGVLKGVIYHPWENGAWPAREPNDRFFGLDFGFNNPTALVEIEEYDGAYYLTERIYQRGLTTADLARQMRNALGLHRGARPPVYADAAEPDRIEELCRAGINVIPANKGQGSVKAGISFVKSLRIFTRPENVNVNKENLTYSWAEDKNGNLLEEPVKFADHAMDGIRYALHTHLRREQFEMANVTLEGVGIF